MKIIFKYLIMTMLGGLIFTSLKSQEEIEMVLKPIQITLLPPIGTNGFESKGCVNKISLNILWGVNGGLEGAEFAGIANFEREFVVGAQFAGFGNFIKGSLNGLSCAGFMNVSGSVDGAQVAHFINIARKVHGAQVSNFMNVAGTVKGVQVGFINIADNYESGAPIGIINIVKNGYHEWEVSSSELWSLNVGYRMGVDKFYTQFMVGGNWREDHNFLGLGFGIGSRFPITRRYLKGSVDLISYQIFNPSDDRMMNPRMGGPMRPHQRPKVVEQARLTIDGKILGHVRWFLGPTLNLFVEPYNYPEVDQPGPVSTRMLYSRTSGVNSVKLWPGFSGGIRF